MCCSHTFMVLYYSKTKSFIMTDFLHRWAVSLQEQTSTTEVNGENGANGGLVFKGAGDTAVHHTCYIALQMKCTVMRCSVNGMNGEGLGEARCSNHRGMLFYDKIYCSKYRVYIKTWMMSCELCVFPSFSPSTLMFTNDCVHQVNRLNNLLLSLKIWMFSATRCIL